MRKTVTATITAALLVLSASAAVAHGHENLPNEHWKEGCRGVTSSTYCS